MFKWIAGRVRCLGGKHERSQAHAQKIDEGDRYTSICMYCRTPMVRRAKRDWVVARKA